MQAFLFLILNKYLLLDISNGLGHFICNFDNPDRPFLFTFITEHSPQEGHCVFINIKNQKVETMRHTSDFRLAAEEEC